MMQGNINPDVIKDALVIGELSLDGIVRHARRAADGGHGAPE